MSTLVCKICGLETFEAYALKRDGKLICPQCSTFYHSTQAPQPPSTPKFKFKIRTQEKPT